MADKEEDVPTPNPPPPADQAALQALRDPQQPAAL